MKNIFNFVIWLCFSIDTTLHRLTIAVSAFYYITATANEFEVRWKVQQIQSRVGLIN